MAFGRGGKGVRGVLGLRENMKRKGVIDVWAKSWVQKKLRTTKCVQLAIRLGLS